jgi:hypothetical protein
MGSTDEQPASELVADLLDTARASRARTMQEVAKAWQRAGTITRNLILMASSEIASIERPATDLVTQLHMYILVAGPEAATSRSQPPSPPAEELTHCCVAKTVPLWTKPRHRPPSRYGQRRRRSTVTRLLAACSFTAPDPLHPAAASPRAAAAASNQERERGRARRTAHAGHPDRVAGPVTPRSPTPCPRSGWRRRRRRSAGRSRRRAGSCRPGSWP